MPARNPFSYAIFRVVPRVERGERVNVGVLAFCRPLGYLGVRTELDERRLLALWPDVDVPAVRAHLRALERIAAGEPDAGPIAALDVTQRFHWLVSPSSTIVQPSEVHTALGDDPDEQLTKLFASFVAAAPSSSGSVGSVVLREIRDDDLPILFEHQRDEGAARMAAVIPRDREAFEAHWTRLRAADVVVTKAIVADGALAGHALSFPRDARREVGYWIGREHWGRGIATKALAAFLEHDLTRPLHAAASRDNPGSLRVLEKCGFQVVGEIEGGLVLHVLL